MSAIHLSVLIPALALISACQNGGESSGTSEVTAYDGIGEQEVLRFAGNEPFWGGEVTGTRMTYDTPENPYGTPFSVQRFTGNGGLSYSGQLDGKRLVMMVSPGRCDDTMADRIYPFVVTLQVDGELRNGCGWTDRQPFTGDANP